MTKLSNYFNDGANAQAQAVLCMLKYNIGYGIEESWNGQERKYDSDIQVSMWENCREQGYVVIMRSKNYQKQLNIAFFEHRNTDDICAVKWEQTTINAPTIESAKFGDVYKDKYDVSHDVGYGEILEMANWIADELTKFWVENSKL